jgi:hypothetical protein
MSNERKRKREREREREIEREKAAAEEAPRSPTQAGRPSAFGEALFKHEKRSMKRKLEHKRDAGEPAEVQGFRPTIALYYRSSNCIPDSLTDSVALFLKRRCDRAGGGGGGGPRRREGGPAEAGRGW